MQREYTIKLTLARNCTLLPRSVTILWATTILLCIARPALSHSSDDVLSCALYALHFSPAGALTSIARQGVPPITVHASTAGEIRYGDQAVSLDQPTRSERHKNRLLFVYKPAKSPSLSVEIAHGLECKNEIVIYRREIELKSKDELQHDLTVTLPLQPFELPDSTWLPLKNGVGASMDTSGLAGYHLAGKLPAKGISLAIPMVSFASEPLAPRCTIVTDPYFSTLFSRNSVEWTYPAKVGLENGVESRILAVVLHDGPPNDAVQAFFDAALPDIPQGPSWLHEIAMVGYDYLSDGGQGWFRDIDALTAVLPPPDRSKVLLCLHGWYDFVGRYCFDPKTGMLDREWTAFSNYPRVKEKFPNSIPVKLTLKDVHDRIAYAKSRGFRCGLYFADGMSAGDSLANIYAPEKVLYWGGWHGPDTKGKTYCQNPLVPQVRDFFLRYMNALLQEYGREIDALVWDETFHVDTGSLGSEALPGYADRAMMRLTRDLTALVHEHNRKAGTQVAFMASDCIGVFPDWADKPPYALVADGTYQDSHCRPLAWSYGIFPNFRNVMWSCNWAPVTNWAYTEFGVRNYQAPVAISNGWGDDAGFSEMSAAMRQKVMDLFDWRKQFLTRLQWFPELPVYQDKKP